MQIPKVLFSSVQIDFETLRELSKAQKLILQI